MSTSFSDSFNVDLFDKWEKGEDKLEQPWSNQITLRCLQIFDTEINAVNSYSSDKEAWSKKFPFTLQDLIDLDEDTAFIVTPCKLYLTEKSEAMFMLSGSAIWLFLVKSLKTVNAARVITGNKKLRLPKECFKTRVITLEAKIGKRYLVREQKYLVRTNKGKYLEDRDRWFDIDLGHFEP